MWIFFLFLFFCSLECKKNKNKLWPHAAAASFRFLSRSLHEVFSQPISFPFSAATKAGSDGCMPFTTSIHFRRAALTSPKKEMKHVGGNCESSGRGYLAVFQWSWASRNGYWGRGKHNATHPVPQLLSVKEHDCTRWPLQHSNWRPRT